MCSKRPDIFLVFKADRTGLEPATSAVTGRHSNQLNYRSLPFVREAKIWVLIFEQKMFFNCCFHIIYVNRNFDYADRKLTLYRA